ncbi:Tubby-like F-box protein 8, partial [Glycine soja]
MIIANGLPSYSSIGSTPTVLLVENGKFLLSAKRTRRTTCTEYIISMNTNNISRSSSTYIGKLRSKTIILSLVNTFNAFFNGQYYYYFQDKWLPLHTLAACGEFYLLDSLLKHNVDINVLKNEDSGPLKESTSLIEHQLVKLTEQSLLLKKRTNQTKPRPIVVRLDDGDVAPISVKRPEPMDDI